MVVSFSEELTRGSIRLGQWMDWGNDYFTFSDTNIEYIWRFLKTVHERDWLFLGHRSTEWCPRCGTSISAHELAGNYVDRADPSLFVRLPLLDRPGESLVVWTTTPWTLPANVAAAVAPDADYGRRLSGEWVAAPRYPDESFAEVLKGSELVGWRYEGPFDDLPPGAAVEHRVIAWDEVSMDEGTGIVHIAPGCGAEDFELSREHDLPVLTPVDESGRFYDDYGWLHGLSTAEAAEQIIGNLEERGRLVEAGLYEHRYPECWRCHTPLIFRIADDWFISVRDLRQPMRDANATVEWVPDYMGKRMDDWLVNMGDWNISRRRYYGLPLPFYPCACGHLNVIGSRAELRGARGRRARPARGAAAAVDRPRADALRVVRRGRRADPRGRRRLARRGHRPVLDAGLAERHVGRGRVRHRRGARADRRRPARPRVLGAVVPGRLGLGDARADPAVVLLAALHVGRARRAGAVQAGARLREDARRDGPGDARLVGQHDRRARTRSRAWAPTSCAGSSARSRPNQNLLFGFGPGQEIKRKLLTLWNSVRGLLVAYGNVAGWRPRLEDLAAGPDGELAALDRWLVERTRLLVAEAEQAYEDTLTVDVVRGVRGVRRRPVELVHPPVAAPVLGRRRGGAADAVVRARDRRCG